MLRDTPESGVLCARALSAWLRGDAGISPSHRRTRYGRAASRLTKRPTNARCA